MKSEENGFWAVQIQLSWIFKREQRLYRLLCRRGQIIKCSQHPSVLLLIERYHCVLVTLENQASSFSFCTGSALEKASFEVMALDEPAFLCPDRQMEIPLTKAYSFLVFFFLSVFASERMRNKCKTQPAAVQPVSQEHQLLTHLHL